MTANRRSYPRHPKRLRVRFRDPKQASWRRCFTLNVSVTGVYLETVRIPRAEQIELEVELDSAETVRLTGQIVHGMRVPTRLQRSVRGGFAVKLLEAPADWYEFCLALGRDRRQTG